MSGGSGRILGAIAGAALAYFTGGISTVLMGAALGSAVGGMLDKGPSTQGPRLDDLKVQVSTYGGAIPTIYGTARVGGNVIWSTDKLEIGTTQTAGKGGGSSNTSYQYFVHMAIALCYGPITGIRKIWQDGKLIYDASSGASVGSALATAQNPYANLVVHYGDESQLPDPIIESWEGVGNVPAYRGIAYVRMIAVSCPAGRVPQFSFEVTTAATVGPAVISQIALVPSQSNQGAVIRPDGIWDYTTSFNGTSFDLTYSFGQSGSLSTMGKTTFPSGGNFPYPVGGTTAGPQVIASYSNGDLLLLDFQNKTQRLLANMGGSTGQGVSYGRAAYDATVDMYVVNSWNAGTTGNDPVIIGGAAQVACATIAGDGHGGVVGFYGGVVHVVTTDGANLIYSRRDSTGAVVYGMPDTIGTGLGNSSTYFSPKSSALYVSANGVYIYCVPVSGGGLNRIFKITPATLTNAGAFTLLCDQTGSNTGTLFNTVSFTFYCTDTLATIGPIFAGGQTGYNAVRFNTVQPNPVNVADIITDQCTKAGLTSGQIDVSTLQDTVWGYIIASVASARNNLQPLLTACAIDAVDEDGKVKFFKRAAITSLATVTYNELACVDGAGAPGDPMPLAHTQEAELPSSIAVNYLNPAYDYQTVTETARRSTDLTRNDQTVDLPLACSADFAASVAQMLIYDAWNERNRRTAQVSRKWAYLSAGDGVTIEYPAGTFQLWRLSKVTDTGTLMQWELSPADATIYTQQAIGSAQPPALQVPPLSSPSTLVLLDMPIVRDADSNAGKYAAMKPYNSTGWQGASLLVGDDRFNFLDSGDITKAAVFGFAETALDPSGLFGQIDHLSQVTVNVGEGALNSTTWDSLFSSGATNLAALTTNFTVDGFPDATVEIFQFRVATSLGSGRYTLTEMVRGLYGTERVAFNHLAGDTFVLLNSQGMLRVSMDPGAIGSTKFYKPVSLGRSPDSALVTSAKTIGYGLKPLSPINVKLDRSPSNGSIVFTWGRRTRMSHNALRQIMPLGESSETYEVVIYTDSSYQVVQSVHRVYSSTFTYASADIASDGYTQSGSIPYRIYQISDAVGRGVPFQQGQGLQ